MEWVYYDLDAPPPERLVRWIQPPQIAYFVTTVDRYGNMNSTPVTMGTCVGPPRHYAFSLSNFVPGFEIGERQDLKHAYLNLKEMPECVLSYIGHDLLRESWIAGLPLPRGISEIEVAGLTPLPSRKVRPCGIRECAVNLELKVLSTVHMPPYHTLYVCDVVGLSVNADYVHRDGTEWRGLGVMAIDPLFEVLIDTGASGNLRLSYARLDMGSVERTPDDIGCLGNVWIGKFGQWLADEQRRGKISEQERQEIMALAARWDQDRNPQRNGAVKAELTARLRAVVQPRDLIE